MSCGSDDSTNSESQANQIKFEGQTYDIGWEAYHIYDGGIDNDNFGIDVTLFPNSISIDNGSNENLRGQGWFVTIGIGETLDYYIDLDDISGEWIGEDELFLSFETNVVFSEDVDWNWEENSTQYVISNALCKIRTIGSDFEIIASGEDSRGISFELYYRGQLTNRDLYW